MGRKYCSHSCSAEDHRDANHWNWQGGITVNRLRFYDSRVWKAKKAEILRRDFYLCQVCGINCSKLEIHHILPYCKFPDLRLDNDNLITVCHACHAKLSSIFHHTKFVIWEL
ncbi:MAG: HNH endonuclease [Deltaproteobacteria bacterium]|nr:HNH endonuclease [Deltaproteobacteria bacterium]